MYLLTSPLSAELQPVRSGAVEDPVIVIGHAGCGAYDYSVSGACIPPIQKLPPVAYNTLLNQLLHIPLAH